MLDTADVTRKFIETIIEIIGRKTSEEYAAVTIRNLLKKLQPTYPFLRNIQIKNARSLEIEETVTVEESITAIHPKLIGKALKELMKIIMDYLGNIAGYFFIRETREKIGVDYDRILLKIMDVDLTLMQSTYIVEKKTINLLDIQNSDILRRFLKSLLNVLEKQTSKSFAISYVSQHVNMLRKQYPFLDSVSINDIRYTLGSEEVTVQTEINNVDSQDLGKAINLILQTTDKTLIELGRNSIAGDLKSNLTIEYLAKLGEMGVTITPYSVGYNAILRQVLKTLIDVIGKTSSEGYAISAINSFLRKIDNKYEFLKQIKVEPVSDREEPYHITILENLDTVSETDVRRAIQQLLEIIIESLGENISDEFIQQFKDALEKKYLSKLEELGVNFHMIELHQAMSIQTE